MASREHVRAYLAYWFQLGKPVVFDREDTCCLPSPIFTHGGYSQPFEQCWQHIEATGGEGCHLMGTDQTLAELLSAKWDIGDCARCDLPIPLPIGVSDRRACPCNDMPQWPNHDVPQPRGAVSTPDRLTGIRDRLQATPTRQRLQQIFQHSPGLPKAPVDHPPA